MRGGASEMVKRDRNVPMAAVISQSINKQQRPCSNGGKKCDYKQSMLFKSHLRLVVFFIACGVINGAFKYAKGI